MSTKHDTRMQPERAALLLSGPALTLPSIVYEYPAMDESSPRTLGRRASRHKAGS
jgi:hypothetical protein